MIPSQGWLNASAPPGVSHDGTSPSCMFATDAATPLHGQSSTKATLLPSGTAVWQPMHCTAPVPCWSCPP